MAAYFHPLLFLSLLFLIGIIVAIIAKKQFKFGHWGSIGIGLLVIVLLGGTYFWSIAYNTPGSKDYDDAKAITKQLTAEYPFVERRSPSYGPPNGPTFYSLPHPRRTSIDIYGVTEKAEQDKILSIVTKARTAVPHKPVMVTFFAEEKFEPLRNPDGSISKGFQRVEQVPLRKEQIDN